MQNLVNQSAFLPTSRKEMESLGWDNVDIILFSGDAYVDHPSFGIAVIGRVLEAEGYRVAVVPQPNWLDDLRDFKKLGRPRLFFGVGSGNMDSMVNHYTAHKRLRSNDAYTPEGRSGARPDRAVTVYSQILKKLYPDVPVVVGGIEASLRRLSHYDFWDDKWKPSVLSESGADYLVYGMGERAIKELAYKMRNRVGEKELKRTRQIAYMEHLSASLPQNVTILNSYEACQGDIQSIIENTLLIEKESLKSDSLGLVEPVADSFVVVNPPFPVMTSNELDAIYVLPFTRLPHPRYKDKDIPAYKMIKHSITLHRGCFGGCNFCALSAHQGKQIVSRSEGSILREVQNLNKLSNFKGVISDMGGPSANMYGMGGKDALLCSKCTRLSCLFPAICTNLNHDHTRITALYQAIEKVEGIRHAFIGSGIRYDLFLNQDGFYGRDGKEYFEQVMRRHTSGHFKVAPEHTEEHVLHYMGKPSYKLFERFKDFFDHLNSIEQLKLKIVPYFISSHPGCTDQDMDALSKKLQKNKMTVEQIQDFTPTPLTRSSVMFYTKKELKTQKEIFVAHSKSFKMRQKSFFFKKK
ncbi:MAG: YgiQ family radical SAM protein [Prevotellaceae bacterium]|jgi:uncharacterized radical SAM protein YgiQ|nr:YgiQ family radical SAM protein [Prevotellaceae bacterium]